MHEIGVNPALIDSLRSALPLVLSVLPNFGNSCSAPRHSKILVSRKRLPFEGYSHGSELSLTIYFLLTNSFSSFNKTRDDFDDLDSYNKYLEDVEDIGITPH